MSHFYRDLLERMLWTFVQAFLGALTATPLAEIFLDIEIERLTSVLFGAFIAGASAVFSLLKSVAAKKLGDPTTAQLTIGGGTYQHPEDPVASPDDRFEFDQ
jgi:NhaP-type Na+/H+ and K+/H+ antiporter